MITTEQHDQIVTSIAYVLANYQKTITHVGTKESFTQYTKEEVIDLYQNSFLLHSFASTLTNSIMDILQQERNSMIIDFSKIVIEVNPALLDENNEPSKEVLVFEGKVVCHPIMQEKVTEAFKLFFTSKDTKNENEAENEAIAQSQVNKNND